MCRSPRETVLAGVGTRGGVPVAVGKGVMEGMGVSVGPGVEEGSSVEVGSQVGVASTGSGWGWQWRAVRSTRARRCIQQGGEKLPVREVNFFMEVMVTIFVPGGMYSTLAKVGGEP